MFRVDTDVVLVGFLYPIRRFQKSSLSLPWSLPTEKRQGGRRPKVEGIVPRTETQGTLIIGKRRLCFIVPRV